MSKTFWDDQEAFHDGAPVMVNGKWQEPETYTPAPEPMVNAAKVREAQALAAAQNTDQEEYDVEGLTEEVSQEDEEDFTEVLSDARLRLEQGKLYELIMNHNLFEGVDADPRAAKSVQRQIRTWAKTQMEIMLGMRQEIIQPNQSFISSPFNSLEVDVLKKLASAASKGATEEVDEEIPQPQPKPAPKKKTLNTIGTKMAHEARTNAKPVGRPTPGEPIQRKAPEPIQRKAPVRPALPPEFEPDYEPLSKPLHEMTAQELAERDRQALERQKSRKAAMPSDRAKMPSYGEMEMMAMSQASRATGASSGLGALNGKLSSLIINNAIKRV